MKFGLQVFATDETLSPSDLAILVEERGFESLFVTEHTHIPANRRTPGPDGRLDLPREYSRTLDPFVTLTAMAVATTRLRVGTGILLVAQHEPLTTAKALASVDLLSGGRLLFGVGAGWNIEELEHHGVAAAERFAVMQEHVEAIRAVWSQEEAAYEGRHVSFKPSWSWPKPVSPPSVLVGGNGARVLDRVLRIGDEWAPADVGPDHMLPRLAELAERSEGSGRSPMPTSMFAATHDHRTLDRYEHAGVHRAVFVLPSLRNRGEMERELDRLAKVASDYDHVEVS
jgi:probable F420-dependent oxidoreductase